MIIKADHWIDGYIPEEPFNSNTTSELCLDKDKSYAYIDVYSDETEKLITRIPLHDILYALSDIIR